MFVDYSYNGLNLRFPERRSFSNCARDIEKKFQDLEKLHFSVHKAPNDNGYLIDLRAVSKTRDIISSIQTNNINMGLKALKSVTINKLREDKNKLLSKSQKVEKNRQLNFFDSHGGNDFLYKKAL
jgi:hypothetical protein